ncbi:MAG: VanZ family protein [Gammaproteobacteria bacterium]|nr:VanZ family protein [Gammaproteobacteria bacterium]
MRIIIKSAERLIHLSHTLRNQNNNHWFSYPLLVVGSILLFVGGPDYYSSRSLINFWNTGHILYFALLTFLLLRCQFIKRLSVINRWLLILIMTLLAGCSIELIQYGTARTPDTGDILRDFSGSFLVLAFDSSGTGLKSIKQQRFLQISSVVLLLLLLLPFFRSLLDEAISRNQFPVLADFETPFEIDRWGGGNKLSVESMPLVSASRLLKIRLTTNIYSGVSLKYFEENWQDARKLNISLYNPDKRSLWVTIRIHDVQHTDGFEEYTDRYNRNFLLLSGWNHLGIDLEEVRKSPLHRKMDMSRIRGVGLFAMSLPKPRLLFIDNVWLSD